MGDKLTDKAASKAEKLHAKAEKLHTTVDRISAKAKVQAESLERLAARLESVELWMRTSRVSGRLASPAASWPRPPSASSTPRASTRCRCGAWPPSWAPAR